MIIILLVSQKVVDNMVFIHSQDSSELIIPGITADIRSYQVSAIPKDQSHNISVFVTADSVCHDQCHFVFRDSRNMTFLFYTMSVTATNLLELGESQSCNNHTIGNFSKIFSDY